MRRDMVSTGVIGLVPSAATSPIGDVPSPGTPNGVAKAVEGQQLVSLSVSVLMAESMRRIAVMFVPRDRMTVSTGTPFKAAILAAMVVAVVIVRDYVPVEAAVPLKIFVIPVVRVLAWPAVMALAVVIPTIAVFPVRCGGLCPTMKPAIRVAVGKVTIMVVSVSEVMITIMVMMVMMVVAMDPMMIVRWRGRR
jgi:hypothetical protein